MLTGYAELREFLTRGTARRPDDIVGFHRSGDFLFDSGRLMWEYPRETPGDDQLDLAEVMDLDGRLIARHRIYWGWRGLALLT